MSKRKLTPTEFVTLRPKLIDELTRALEREIEDCALPELIADTSTDLWSVPRVDSKTVVKLSPAVKALTGWSLDPTWIQKGGYATVDQAVTHLVAQIHKHCVAESTVTRSSVLPTTASSHA